MKKLSALIILISLSIFFIFSCQKDKTSSPTYSAGESNSLRTTVTGIVLDETNAPLSGVTITAYGQTATTNQYGTFVFKNIGVNKNRCVLQFSKTGFLNRAHGFIASANTVNYVRIVLITNPAPQTLSASSGGTISLIDGSTVDFQPNSFVTSNGTAYTGTVNIAVKHLSPDDANFGFMIPGGDLLGTNMNDEDVALYTYGMLGVTLTGSSGEALQLADNKTATLTMPIAASQLTDAPANIPLWYFDETTSLWKEEGAANKVGNNYVGTVKHFSWWNCDIGANSPYIKGRVLDCEGIPVANCVVTVNGWATTLTNQNGEWQGQVPAGMPLTAQVLASNNGGAILNSQLENIPALSNNQTFTVPDLIVPCPTRVIGTIKSCSGEITNGFAYISNSSFYNFQYTINGSFNLPAIENSQAELFAMNLYNYTFLQTITTLSVPNNLNVGNLLLCDSIALAQNTFVLDGGPFSNQTFNFNIAFNEVEITPGSSPTININTAGTAQPNYNINGYYITINDTVPGISTCNVTITFTDGTSSWNLYGNNLPCLVSEAGTVGNKIKGHYSGSININANGNWVPGAISGSFDVIRTQ